VLVQLDSVSKAYGGQTLFRDLSWRITGGERIGLVGPNGAGKTTLCRILAGLEEPDSGRVIRARGAAVGYLPQEVAASGLGSVLGEALSGFEDVWRLEREMEEVAAALEASPRQALTARYGDLQHRFDALGGYRLESEARTILSGLGFGAADLHRPLAELSGGWRMRAALARLLLLRPALLLLDEPTNHLDLESLAWLENFLAGYDGTVVVVAHDRYFLNRMVSSVADLGPAGLTVYPGNYDAFVVERQARRELREAQARNQAKRVAEIERFIERFRYQATRARQVQSRVKMLARLERIEIEDRTRRIRVVFPEPPRTGRRVATLCGIHKAYGDNVVYAGIDFDIERGDRVALVGVNGAGKSTLLRILAGVLPFERGERTLGAHVAVHYYAQHQVDALSPERTVLEELEAVAPEAAHMRLRALLGAFLFSGDAVDKKVSVLSGGEKARLALAKMLVRPTALLCLDEPTNHLDLASREVLEDALAGFSGTIVFISHDRYFINRMATKIVEIAGGALTTYLGDYDDYLAAKARMTTEAAEGRGALRPSKGNSSGGPPAPPRPRRRGHLNAEAATESSAVDDGDARDRTKHRRRVDPEVRELRRRLEEVERQIHALEERLRQLGDTLGDPNLYADGERVRAVALERKSAEEQVAWLMREWEALSTELAAHE
jgi:ATP-binding cassette subfamily F protein 3